MTEQEAQIELDKYLLDKTDLILVTYNRLEFTRRCLGYLLDRTRTPNRLIVADNGSTDGTPDYLLTLQKEGKIDTLILLGRNYGLEHARQIALTHVQSKYHVYFDNDLVCPDLEPDWLSQEIAMMEKYPDYGAMAMHPQLLVGAAIDLSPTAPEIIENNHVGATFLIMRTELMKEAGWRTTFTNRVADWYYAGKFHEKGFKSGWIRDLWCYHFFHKNWGYQENEDHFHRVIWPTSDYFDRLVEPKTLVPMDTGGVDMYHDYENLVV